MTIAILRDQLLRDKRLTFSVKVTPKSSRNEVTGFLDDGTMKLKIAAVPEKGKANAEVCDFLADQFGVARRSVQIVRGATSPLKHIVISI
jgi:uncharacterized protein (TIGR00251 family)